MEYKKLFDASGTLIASKPFLVSKAREAIVESLSNSSVDLDIYIPNENIIEFRREFQLIPSKWWDISYGWDIFIGVKYGLIEIKRLPSGQCLDYKVSLFYLRASCIMATLFSLTFIFFQTPASSRLYFLAWVNAMIWILGYGLNFLLFVWRFRSLIQRALKEAEIQS